MVMSSGSGKLGTSGRSPAPRSLATGKPADPRRGSKAAGQAGRTQPARSPRARALGRAPVPPGAARKAVVLLSGGLDSTTVLAVAQEQGFVPYALSFRYGQRHHIELAAAQAVAQKLGAAGHIILDIDLRSIGGSALTADLPVPKDRDPADLGKPDAIPITYVPARNTIFLSYALAYAEVLGAADIFLGINALDYSGYPDCRPEYLRAFQRLADLATRAGVQGQTRMRLHAPLLSLTKAQIIARGVALGVDYGLTRSCYDPEPDGAACGRCDSCQLRLLGFAANGRPDPAPYATAVRR